MKRILIIFVFLPILLFAQKFDANEVLNKAVKEYEKINDYTADIHLKVDISYLKMPDVYAKVYFKKPDKFHFDSEGFALIPKQGINFSPAKLLEKEHTAVDEGIIEENNQKFYQIKVLPKETTKGPSLLTFQINTSNYTIKKLTILGEKEGKSEIEFYHTFIDNKYWVIRKMIFTADIGNLKFRRKQTQQNIPLIPENDHKTGKVYIDYSNYQINKGIDDKIFQKSENEKTNNK